jgi:hypothetical protein
MRPWMKQNLGYTKIVRTCSIYGYLLEGKLSNPPQSFHHLLVALRTDLFCICTNY